MHDTAYEIGQKFLETYWKDGFSRILAIASHSPDLIKRLCNKAILLDHGEVKVIGPATEVLEQYRAAT